MKIISDKIDGPMKNEEVQAIIENEWDEGILYEFKKEHPDAVLVVSPAGDSVDYWVDIFDTNGEIVARFSMVDSELEQSLLTTN